jgi:hypothetical protein
MKCFAHRIPLTAALLALACMIGCADRGPRTVPVYGKVTFVGRERPKFCRLYFRPIEAETITRPSTSTPAADGTYEVKSFRDSKGLLPGTYNVEVTFFDLKPGADPNIETNYIESVFDAGELVVDADAGSVEHDIEVPAKAAKAAR